MNLFGVKTDSFKSRIIPVMIFALIFVLINYVLNLWYQDMMYGSHIRTTDRNFHVYAPGDSIKYLILGHSHSFGLLGNQMVNGVNFGSYGEDISRSYYKLKYALERNPVEYVVLNFDLSDVDERTGLGRENLYYWLRYVDFWELGRVKGEVLDYSYKYAKARFFSYADGEMDVFEYLFPKDQNDLLIEDLENVTVEVSNKSEYKDCLEDKLSPEGLYYFTKIVELAHSRSVKLVLLKYPVTEAYYHQVSYCYSPEAYYERLMTVLAPYDNIEILDYQKTYFDSLALFRDSNHLTAEFRPTFTSIIEQEIISRY